MPYWLNSSFCCTVMCSVWCVACGVWRVVCGVWRVVCSVWCLVCGVWCECAVCWLLLIVVDCWCVCFVCGVLPGLTEPEIVVTSLSRIASLRMQWLPMSATIAMSLLSTSMPYGLKKRAWCIAPSWCPTLVPLTVDTYAYPYQSHTMLSTIVHSHNNLQLN